MNGNWRNSPTRMPLWLRRSLIGLIWAGAAIGLIAILIFSNPIAAWLQRWALIQILDALSKLGVLVAVIAFLWEMPQRAERAEAERKRSHFEYWQAIDAAATARTPTSHARKTALESLASEGVSLRNIDAKLAELRRINLAQADLVGANLRGADLTGALLQEADLSKASLAGARLYGANLFNANLNHTNLRGVLYDPQTQFPSGFDPTKAGAILIAPHVTLPGVMLANAKLWSVNLQGANLKSADFSKASLQGANLKETNFQGANLRGARFGNADLEDANLEDADLEGASFWHAKGITPAQIQSAKHWDLAEYDSEFREQLGL